MQAAFPLIDPPEELRRGDGKGRLAHDDGAVRQGGKLRQDLPASLRQHGPADDAVGHVAADAKRERAELLRCFSCVRESVQRPQHGGRVRGPAAHPGADGDALLDADGGAETRAVQKELRRAQGEVPVVRGEKTLSRNDGKAPARVELDVDLVPEIHRLHDHPQVMVAVGILPEDVEGEIQLCRRVLFHGSHLSILICLRLLYTVFQQVEM